MTRIGGTAGHYRHAAGMTTAQMHAPRGDTVDLPDGRPSRRGILTMPFRGIGIAPNFHSTTTGRPSSRFESLAPQRCREWQTRNRARRSRSLSRLRRLSHGSEKAVAAKGQGSRATRIAGPHMPETAPHLPGPSLSFYRHTA